MSLPVSAVIISKNEAENIGQCINSLKNIVSEIIVVDSGSKDNTIGIAKKLGAKVIETEWLGYAKTKNFANEQAAYNWILSIDADEVLSDELINTLQGLTLIDNTVYSFNRLNNFCGQWIRHAGWFPDWKIRIFNKKNTFWTGDFVHETLSFTSPQKTKRLKGLLLHYSYQNLDDHWSRIDRYSSLSAQELFRKEKKPSWIKQKGGPIFRFIKTFFFQLGFLEGKAGWIISYRAAQMVKMKYQKFNQLRKKEFKK